jgi:hypothetical protein
VKHQDKWLAQKSQEMDGGFRQGERFATENVHDGEIKFGLLVENSPECVSESR